VSCSDKEEKLAEKFADELEANLNKTQEENKMESKTSYIWGNLQQNYIWSGITSRYT